MVVAIALEARVVDAKDDIIGTISCCCRLLQVSKFGLVLQKQCTTAGGSKSEIPQKDDVLIHAPALVELIDALHPILRTHQGPKQEKHVNI